MDIIHIIYKNIIMYNHINYMQSCAEVLKAIAHTEASPRFHIIGGIASMDELLQNLSKADEGFHLLAPNNVDGSFSIANDVPLDKRMLQFYVVKRNPFTDYVGMATAKTECHALAAKIISRMAYHAYLANLQGPDTYGLRDLDIRTISYQSVGPLADNFYGIEVTFTLYSGTNFIYNQDDWNE